MNIAEYKMTVPNGKEVTLNLNGKTLEAANNGNITVNGTFTLQDNASNGTIKATKRLWHPYTTGIICVSGEDAKMTMKGGYISAVRTDPVSRDNSVLHSGMVLTLLLKVVRLKPVGMQFQVTVITRHRILSLTLRVEN